MPSDKQTLSGAYSDLIPAKRVLLVAPSPPPYGGMALQARLLERLLRGDGQAVSFFASNAPLPGALRFLERVPVARTIARLGLIWPKLWSEIGEAEIVHILAASWVYFFLVVYPAVLFAWMRGRRIVLNYRGGAAERFFHFYGWVVRPAFHLAHEVTVPSEFLAKPIRESFGIDVSIIPNILDSTLFPYKRRVSFAPRILVNRHLDPIYDVECVLKAFHLIQERVPEASLWIAGTGSEQNRLRDLASALNLQNIRFLGHLTHQELGGVYDQCDILLNASRVDNFPGALIEASGAGLVIVSTRAGGIPYIYQDRKSAMLVDLGDCHGLAGAVEAVLENPVWAAELTQAALAAVQACQWAEVRPRLYQSYGWAAASAPQCLETCAGPSITRSAGN